MGRRTFLWTGINALAVLAVVGLLWVVLTHIGFGRIIEAMRRVSPRAILAAASLHLTVFVLWTFRWQQLMKPEDRKSIVALWPIYMAGVFGNVVTPGARVGGEPIRAFYMSRAFGGEKTVHLGTVLVDKLGNSAVFMVFLLGSLVFILFSVPLAIGIKAALGGILLLAVGAVTGGLIVQKKARLKSRLLARALPALYNSTTLTSLRRLFPHYEHFEIYVIRKLDNVLTPMARAAGSPKALAKIILISGASWLLFYMAHFVLFAALGVNVSFLKVLVIVTISDFVADISFVPGGMGFAETTMIGLCAAFGLEAHAAAAVALISRGLLYVYGLGLGGLCLGVLTALYGRRARQ